MILCGSMWMSGAAHGVPRPTLASVMAKVACSAATHRSHICANNQPPAIAMPFTAAMVGLLTWMASPRVGMKPRGGTARPVALASFRSIPAQKARSPAPVSIATLADSSSSKRFQAANRPARTSALIALRLSGLLIVMSATGALQLEQDRVTHRKDLQG